MSVPGGGAMHHHAAAPPPRHGGGKTGIGSGDPGGGGGTSAVHKDALRVCEEVQHMIDINSDHLDRLRVSLGDKPVTSGRKQHCSFFPFFP